MEKNEMIRFEVGKVYKASRSSNSMVRITRRTDHNVWYQYARENGTASFEEVRRKIDTYTSGRGETTEVLWGTIWIDSFYANDEVDYDEVVKNYRQAREVEKKAQDEKFQRSVKDFQEWMRQEGLTIEVVERVNRKMQDANYNMDNVISYLLRQGK